MEVDKTELISDEAFITVAIKTFRNNINRNTLVKMSKLKLLV